jgi:hypothetical protein
MYYAIYLDDFLKTKDYFEYKEVGRAGVSVIIKHDSEPQVEYVEITEEEALHFMFADLPPGYGRMSVRPNTAIHEILKDRPMEQVPEKNRRGDILEGLYKYKYDVTEKDLEIAASLKKKIAKWIPYYEETQQG